MVQPLVGGRPRPDGARGSLLSLSHRSRALLLWALLPSRSQGGLDIAEITQLASTAIQTPIKTVKKGERGGLVAPQGGGDAHLPLLLRPFFVSPSQEAQAAGGDHRGRAGGAHPARREAVQAGEGGSDDSGLRARPGGIAPETGQGKASVGRRGVDRGLPAASRGRFCSRWVKRPG